MKVRIGILHKKTERGPTDSSAGPAGRSGLWLHVATLLAISMASLFAPENVLERSPIIANYVSIFSERIPSIRRLAAISAFPGVTALVGTLVWSVLPFQILYFMTSPNVELDVELIQGRPYLWGLAIPICTIAFITMFFVMEDFSAADLVGGTWGDKAIRITSLSRIGLATMACLSSTFIAIMATLLYLFCRHIPEIYFSKR